MLWLILSLTWKKSGMVPLSQWDYEDETKEEWDFTSLFTKAFQNSQCHVIFILILALTNKLLSLPSVLSWWMASAHVLINIWASWSIWSRSVSVILPYSDIIWLRNKTNCHLWNPQYNTPTSIHLGSSSHSPSPQKAFFATLIFIEQGDLNYLYE